MQQDKKTLSENLNLVAAGVGHDKNPQVEKSIRESEIKWLPPEGEQTLWVFEKMMHAVHAVNKHYRFNIESIEAMQIARYTNGGFYDWHLDMGTGSTSRRKLSVSVQLSRPEEYEGGDLQFMGVGGYEPVTTIGSAITFPSYLLHRVTPVTKGTRWSLVAWVVGSPFR